MGGISQNNRTVCSFQCVFSWNSRLMISNQRCAHAQRQIIRTQCFFTERADDRDSQRLQSDDKTESFSAAAAHVLAVNMRHE